MRTKTAIFWIFVIAGILAYCSIVATKVHAQMATTDGHPITVTYYMSADGTNWAGVTNSLEAQIVPVAPAAAPAPAKPVYPVSDWSSWISAGAHLCGFSLSAGALAIILLGLKYGCEYWNDNMQNGKYAHEVTAFGRLVARVAANKLPVLAADVPPPLTPPPAAGAPTLRNA